MSISESPCPQLDATEALSVENSYTQLVAALHPPQPSILEIDILPSTYPPQILIDPPALALPKSLLAKLFLLARRNFFDNRLQSLHIGDEGYDARLKATSILLLFDPNHVTAANFRKRHILQCSRAKHTDPREQHAAESAAPPLLAEALSNELAFLTGLLTSPLNKHAKSSTLWAQRLWLHQQWLDVLLNMEDTETDKSQAAKDMWSRELHVVMKAGERHPRNYYAWNYARQLFGIVRFSVSRVRDYQDLLTDTSGEVHRWCLMQPRDISGWAFLGFWLEKVRDQVRTWEHLRSSESIVEGEVGRVARGTKAWVKKYDWAGESVEWFLKALEELALEGQQPLIVQMPSLGDIYLMHI